mmetsp:Transcript_5285/g.14655  ORF Transcript_5285/g.14655 Transcript_5285/m.14655 type:complete len:153 (-) Transcript_5285:189-647(-)
MITQVARAMLFLNGFMLLGAGVSYLKGVSSNTFESLDGLFSAVLAASCSHDNDHQCWLALVPFNSVTYIALGALGMLASVSFRSYETIIVFFLFALTNGAQVYLRVYILPGVLFQSEKASSANLRQGTFCILDIICVCALTAELMRQKTKVE